MKLATGENELIHMPYAGQKYLRAGDYLVKESHNQKITLYRRFPAYTEVSVFGGDSTDEGGLAKRYQIKKP
ncbi:hypothetical protein [Hymenobacter ruber]